MKDWTWKNTLGLAAVIFSVWLISYIVEWNTRTKGKIYWGDALFGWWGDVVMLGWVYDFQALLAGLFASSAIIAVLLQIREQRRQYRSNKLAALRATFLEGESIFGRIRSAFGENGENLDDIRASVDSWTVRAHHAMGHIIANILIKSAYDGLTGIGLRKSGTNIRNARRSEGDVIAAHVYTMHITPETDVGGNYLPSKLPKNIVEQHLNGSKIHFSELKWTNTLFE